MTGVYLQGLPPHRPSLSSNSAAQYTRERPLSAPCPALMTLCAATCPAPPMRTARCSTLRVLRVHAGCRQPAASSTASRKVSVTWLPSRRGG